MCVCVLISRFSSTINEHTSDHQQWIDSPSKTCFDVKETIVSHSKSALKEVNFWASDKKQLLKTCQYKCYSYSSLTRSQLAALATKVSTNILSNSKKQSTEANNQK